MTPLEKASQMIVDYQLTIKSLSYEEAVQCSIRTVDEIIYEIIKYADNSRQYVVDNIKYWREVRQLLEKQLNKMTLRHALLILQSHQKWRLGDEFAKATEPKLLTEAISTILEYHIGSSTALIDQIGEINKMVHQVPDVGKMVEISDEEIEKAANEHLTFWRGKNHHLTNPIHADRTINDFKVAIKWYREQLKKKL